MIKLAFTLIGGRQWMGGYNYQRNLIKALTKYESDRIKPYLFLGQDVDEEILKSFTVIDGLNVIQSRVFDQGSAFKRLLRAIVLGRDKQALKVFLTNEIDVVFEAANFYGWRFPISTIAWIPDLQHKLMPHLFSRFSYWKREIGFQFQMRSGRNILLSSEDAKASFEQFYPNAKGNADVARFAVPAPAFQNNLAELKNEYNLPEHFFFMPNQFWQHKNHECVIKALAIAKEQGCNMVIVSTGRTEDPRKPQHFAELKAMVASLKLEKEFRILGAVPYQHIAALMQACDALVNPSFFEGWSTTVEEAKALGVRMILSNIAVHKEQADNQADFFDPKSSHELAEKLVNFKRNNQHNELTYEQAKKDSNIRVSIYAKTFADIVTSCSSTTG